MMMLGFQSRIQPTAMYPRDTEKEAQTREANALILEDR